MSYTVSSRPFSVVLRGSCDIPTCSWSFPNDLCLLPSVLSFSVCSVLLRLFCPSLSISVVVSIIPLSVPFHVFRLSPYFGLFPFSFPYWDPTVVSLDLLLICLHFCFSHNPVLHRFPYVIVLLSYDFRYPFEL